MGGQERCPTRWARVRISIASVRLWVSFVVFFFLGSSLDVYIVSIPGNLFFFFFSLVSFGMYVPPQSKAKNITVIIGDFFLLLWNCRSLSSCC